MQKCVLNDCTGFQNYFILHRVEKNNSMWMFAAKIFYTFLLPPEQSQQTVLTNPVSQIIKLQAVMKNY